MKFFFPLSLFLILISSCKKDDDLILGTPLAQSATMVSDSSFNANWQTISGAMEYDLQISLEQSFKTIDSAINNLGGPTSVSYVESNTEYFYRVRARANNAEPSAYSNVISVYTMPSAPVSTQGTDISTTSFTANWLFNEDANTYLVYVSKNFDSDGPVDIVSGYDGLEVNTTSLSVTGLTKNTVYYYQVKCKSGNRVSEFSNIQSVLTAL